MTLAAKMVRLLSQNDILSEIENQAVNIGGLANTGNSKTLFLTEAVHTSGIMLCHATTI